MKIPTRKQVQALSVLLTAFFVTGIAAAKDKLPDVTTDGLVRVESKNVDALYKQEGASLAGYTEVMILECPVAFRKNWMRDQNRDRIDLSNRVSQSDMDRIKSALSEAFKEQFTKELEKGGYKVVDQPGEDVLLLRPAITNLDVTAPDVRMSTGMRRVYTASAGSMTLYMELYDSATSAKIAEVADSQSEMGTNHFQISNSVTNRAEANRILSRWAGQLVKALDEANSTPE